MISKHRLRVHPDAGVCSCLMDRRDDGRHIVLPNHWDTPVGMPCDVSVESTCLMHRNLGYSPNLSRVG